MDTFENNTDNNETSELKKTTLLSEMYENWFLDYASYVILERAVPDLKDGLKPVQRRLLHSMKELDDGRYNKVANIIGNTMKYHPHGDASIGDALVQMGQKDLLIDMQGNWGNIHTGDSAAASRYIEARLSKFALDIVFNPKTTDWKPSYDGRNNEPITLPVKFPLLLAQGSEGIAVGLASKILPHNFNELIDACISLLNGDTAEILPDFPTGGLADFSKYNEGLRGGRVKIRARIVQLDKKTLCITELPFGKTTGTLIDTIILANDKGKIKIKKIEDNTAENVEIIIHLAPGISPDQTIDALFAFTDCEYTISPNSCVIDNKKPKFLPVSELLEISNQNTVRLLKLELTIKKSELLEQLFFSSLEKIFIEKRIYRSIEKCETWEDVISTIDLGLEKFKNLFYREITRDDIIRLTEIKIKRISKYDSFKTDEHIKSLEELIKETDYHLNHLIEYAVKFYLNIKEKYGKGKERKTEIRNFDTIEASKVAVANEKLYVNRAEGFAGTSLKKDEFVGECSDIDDIIAIREDGAFIVTKITDKVFLGKNILHIAVFKKNDERTIYNLMYLDGSKGRAMVKRFAVTGVQRDKEYKLVKGNKHSKILYFTANPNGEAEVVTVYLKPKPRIKKLQFDFDFSTIEIKNRNSGGNILSKYQIRKIVLKEEGISTLSAKNIWYDDTVKKLNTDGRGVLLGSFSADDKIVSFNKSGTYKLTGYDITTHFEDDMTHLVKFNETLIVTAIYFDSETQSQYIKRFNIEPLDKKVSFIGENDLNYLISLSLNWAPKVKIIYPQNSKKKIAEEVIDVNDFIGVKGFKAKGKRLTTHTPESVEVIEAEEPVKEVIETSDNPIVEDNIEVINETNAGSDIENQNMISEEMSIKVDENFIEIKEKDRGLDAKKGNNKKKIIKNNVSDIEAVKTVSESLPAKEKVIPKVKKVKEEKEAENKTTPKIKEKSKVVTPSKVVENKENIKTKPGKSVKKEIKNIPLEPIPEKVEPLKDNDNLIVESEKPELTDSKKELSKKKITPKKSKKQENPGALDLFSQLGLDLD